MTSTNEVANQYFDQLAYIIETRVGSMNYKLDPEWFEHVRWTPCGWNIDPCRPYPFEMRTKSFRMELCPHSNKEKFAQWLIVQESTIGTDAGYGLFADRFFKKNDIVTVYVGKKAGTKPTDETRRLEISGRVIDVQPTYFGARPLYFGAHFANSPYFQIPDDQHDAYDRNVHAGKNANAEIVGLLIQCTQDIARGDEIRLDYGHRTTPAATPAKMDKPVKKRARKLGNKCTISANKL